MTAPRVIRDVARLLVLSAIVARRWSGPALRRLLRRPVPATEVGRRLRETCEALGITYVKLGQYLAARFDLLPMAVARELGRLFDSVEPMPYDELLRQIGRELGRPAETVFASVERVPLGSASVAQVHRARTRDGRDLAVKVRRPGVQERFDSDMRNLSRLARIVDALGVLHGVPLADAAREFETFTRRELDFRLEAATMDTAARETSAHLEIPAVHADLVTPGLLAMAYVEGVTLARAIEVWESGGRAALDSLVSGLDLARVNEDLTLGTLHQIFVTGHFQADPHPGNVIIRPDGRLVLVDFGIYGRLSPGRVETLSSYVENLVLGNIDAAYRSYLRLLTPSAATDTRAFEREFKALLWKYYIVSSNPDVPLVERHLGSFADRILSLLYRYRIQLEINTLLFWRALIVLDSTSLRPSQHFDLQGTMRTFFEQVRPGAVERVLAIVGDPAWHASVAALPQLSARAHRRALAIQATPLAARTTERARERTVEDSWLTFAMLSAGTLALASATARAGLDPSLVPVAVAVAVIVISATRLSRRRA
ncbi:AarF/UbiB family protein [Solirubrobacter taibaiensis]|nr:AarF/UbiB family protein [Solirubrobacter taibaiensis]